MKAFHGYNEIKQKYLDRVIAHAKADEIIKGKYWENGKGCAVGCTIHSGDHKAYETELGIPEWLARLEDRVFEGLPDQNSMEWPQKFLNAINPGADLDKIKGPFMIFILESTLDKFNHDRFPKVKESIDKVITLYKDSNSTIADFKSARSAAYTAATAATTATADAAAYAAAYAATAAAAAAASYADARNNAYGKFSDKLLELLSNCHD